MDYYIGIDGGATKTALCAAGVDNKFLRYSKTSGTSWREHGIEKAAQKLKESVLELIGGDYSRIGGIALGLPGYGESAEGDPSLVKAVHDVFAGIRVFLTNDSEAGWAGSMALAPGINIVAGTGSICYGKDNHGRTARSGGWSAFFGDEGSCHWVGRKVMEVFSKQSDGRMARDVLYDIVRRELNLSNDISFIDLMHTRYIGSREQVARLQLLAEKAALAGSPGAKALYEEAVMELLLLVSAVRNQLDFDGNRLCVSYSGGLFKAGDLVLTQFSSEIEKRGWKLSAPRFSPVEGAVLLAFQHFYPEGLPQIQKIMTESK